MVLGGEDELGRTPLHWACASGHWRLAEMLLTRSVGEGEVARMPAEIDAVELRGKTALHIATAHDRADIVQLLLTHKASVNAASDGGWTPLHNACDKGCEEIVRILVSEGAHINAQLLNGITPLHLAAQGGHKEVVECLLEKPELKRRVRDNFGSTPFLRAAQFKRKDIVLLLAPFNNVESLSDDVKEACAAFDATVVDFGNFHNENRVKRMSVFNLLYGRDRENPRKQAVTTVPADSRGADFRWIHLPANNMAWVEALLTKSFIEEGAHDVDGFKGLEKSFNYQHRGQRTHSHFMRPLCQNTPRTLLRRYEEETSEEPVSENGQAKTMDSAARKQKSTGGKPDKVDSYFHDEGPGSHGKKKQKHQKRGKSGSAPGTPKQEMKGKSPWAKARNRRGHPHCLQIFAKILTLWFLHVTSVCSCHIYTSRPRSADKRCRMQSHARKRWILYPMG
jgi:FOG: Ankyrin repeat